MSNFGTLKNIAALTFLLAGTFSVIWWRCGYAIDFLGDYSLLLDCSYRWAIGMIPYRDFFFPTTPLAFGLSAFFLKIFNFHYQGLKFFASLEGALCVALTYYFCRKLLSLSFGKSFVLSMMTAIWLPQLYWGRPWYNNTAAFFSLAACVAAFKFWIDEKYRWMALAGFCAALTFWSKQDVGAGALVGSVLSALLFDWQSWKKSKGKAIAACLSGIGIVFGLFLSYLQVNSALNAWWEATVVRGVKIKFTGDGAGSGVWHMPDLFSLGRAVFSPWHSPENRTSLVIVVLYGAAALWSGLRYWAAGQKRDLGAVSVILIALASYYAGIFTHAGKTFNTLLAHFGCVLGFLFLEIDFKRINSDDRYVSFWRRQNMLFSMLNEAPRAAFLAAVCMGIYGLKYIEFKTWQQLDYSLKNERLRGLMVDARQGRSFDEALSLVQEKTNNFFAPNLTALYYASSQKPPHHTALHGWCFAGDSDRVVEDLKKAKTEMIIIDFPIDDLSQIPSERLCNMISLKRHLEQFFSRKESIGDLTIFYEQNN